VRSPLCVKANQAGFLSIIAPNLKGSNSWPTQQFMIKNYFIWIEHHRDLVEEVAGQMPQTRLIDVCDREADFFLNSSL
jgi:hypothetical protein